VHPGTVAADYAIKSFERTIQQRYAFARQEMRKIRDALMKNAAHKKGSASRCPVFALAKAP
jgi:hypothetical protein